MKTVTFLTAMLFTISCAAQPKTDSLLAGLLLRGNYPLVQQVVKEKDSFRLQVIYTQIDRDRHNKPSFINYYFNVDSDLYFNPASVVKLPVAALALEKIAALHKTGLSKYSTLQVDSSYPKQTAVTTDSTSPNYQPSIAHYIRKALLVSDNDAYNRLYQFVGQQTINRQLREKGYRRTRITRQFLGLSQEANRHTNAMRFFNNDGSVIYTQPAAYNQDSFHFDKVIKLGRGHYNSQDSLVMEPIDFTTVNNLPLEELQQMLQSIVFPQSVAAKQRFHLSKDDRQFLLQYLSQYPAQTNFPAYDPRQYYDSYVKFYFRDSTRPMPSYLRVFNKVGWAYGFLIDVSYVVDFKNKVEFMLTSTVYTNSDGILNDGKYDYETVGWPFLYQLGQLVYQHELARPRKHVPNLQSFKIPYETRDEKSTRPLVRDVDN